MTDGVASSSSSGMAAALPFRETLIEQAQLDECDRIDLNFLGSIQGDTARVAFVQYGPQQPGVGNAHTDDQVEIVATDANFHTLPCVHAAKIKNQNNPSAALLGLDLMEVLPKTIVQKIVHCMEDILKPGSTLVREFVFTAHEESYYSICVSHNRTTTTIGHMGGAIGTGAAGTGSSVLHYPDVFGLEFELLDELEMLDLTATSQDLHATLERVGRALDQCATGPQAAKLACDAIFSIVGHFDRGMVYYFHDDLSGEVIHEVKKKTLHSSYNGMHFPAADIPQSARLLYVKNVVRYIKSIDGSKDVPILSKMRHAMDLCYIRSRSVHECHLIYLKGMGVTSAMSLALINGNGELWGLLSYHGYNGQPFRPMLHRLVACETIAARVSARIQAQAAALTTTRMLQMGHLLFRQWNANHNAAVVAAAAAAAAHVTPTSTAAASALIQDNLEKCGDAILQVLEADCLAARFSSSANDTSEDDAENAKISKSAVLSVAKGDPKLLPRGLFWNKCSNQVPNFSLTCKSTRRAMQAMGLNETNYPGAGFVFMHGNHAQVMVGRAYRTRDVVWAGDPDAPKINIGGMLHPRASFEAQIETARRDSHPFDLLDQQLAQRLLDQIFAPQNDSNIAALHTWLVSLLYKDVKERKISSFNALEDGADDESAEGGDMNNQLMSVLGDDLRNLHGVLTKSKRKSNAVSSATPKAKNKVTFAEFAEQTVAGMRAIAEPTQLDFHFDIYPESKNKTRPIFVDHTEIHQIVANLSKKAMESSGDFGRVDTKFYLAEDLMSAIRKIEPDAAENEGFVMLLQEYPVLDAMTVVKEYAEQVEEEEHQQWFCFSVTDSGNGMKKDQLKEMFQSLSHADKRDDDDDEVKSASIRKAGLGLLVCVELCRRLGGFIACVSTQHEGTVFYVGIPVGSADATIPRGQDITVSGPILIVGEGEESLVIEKELKTQLKAMKMNTKIIKASDGRDAASMFAKEEGETPSVMIIDYHISGDMDGLETVTKVRTMEKDRNLQPCHIVSLTADVADNAAVLLLGGGRNNEVTIKAPPAQAQLTATIGNLPTDFIPNLARRFVVDNMTVDDLMKQVMQCL